MSRLIDADRLKIMFQFFYDEKLRNLLFEAVDNQPIAYDVEAVVRELEKEYEATIDLYHRTADVYFSGKAYGLDIAIEIVRGGRND